MISISQSYVKLKVLMYAQINRNSFYHLFDICHRINLNMSTFQLQVFFATHNLLVLIIKLKVRENKL